MKEQKGLNLNATDGLGNTALHYSAHHDHPGNSLGFAAIDLAQFYSVAIAPIYVFAFDLLLGVGLA